MTIPPIIKISIPTTTASASPSDFPSSGGETLVETLAIRMTEGLKVAKIS